MPKSKYVITRLSFPALEAARRASVSQRQLTHWLKQGYITASARESVGHGPAHELRFSFRDLQDFNAIALLVRAGASPRAASRIIARLRQDGIKIPQDAVLIGNGKDVVLVDRESNVFDALRNLQGAFALFLGIEVRVPEREPKISSGSLASLPRIRRARARARRTA